MKQIKSPSNLKEFFYRRQTLMALQTGKILYYDLSSNTLLAITLGLKEKETSISFLPTKLLPRSKTYCKLNKQVSQKFLTKALRTMSHLCKSLAINRHRNFYFCKKICIFLRQNFLFAGVTLLTSVIRQQ